MSSSRQRAPWNDRLSSPRSSSLIHSVKNPSLQEKNIGSISLDPLFIMYLLILGLFLATTIHAAPSKGRQITENGAICEGKASAFFVVDNTQLTAGDNVIYKDFSEDECMTTCSNNRDPFGRSILCSSFVYDHVIFTCTIFKDKSRPEGKGEKTAAAGKRYFEKFCLAEDLPMDCSDSQFTRSDDSVLVGFATNVSLTESLEDCVATCVRNNKCLSAMYFYEEGECITNTESSFTRPASFTKEDTEKVIYFTNGCPTKKSSTAKTFKQPSMIEPIENHPSLIPSKTMEKTGEEYEEKQSNEGSGDKMGERKGADGTDLSKKKSTKEKTEMSTEKPLIKEEGGSEEGPFDEEEQKEEEKDEEDMHALIGDEYDDQVDQSNTTNITTTSPSTLSAHKDDEVGRIIESEDQDAEEALLDEQEQSFEEETQEPSTEASTRKHSNEKTKVLKYKKPAREFASKTVTAYKEDRKSKRKEMERKQTEMNEVMEEEEEEDHGGEEGEEPVNVAASHRATEEIDGDATRQSFIKSTETPVDPASLFSDWSDWTPCTKSGERRVRRRKCLDLRRCLGALMQVENCPAVTTPTMVPDDYDQPPLESVRSIVPEPRDRDSFQDQGAKSVPLPPVPEAQPSVWSPWLGVCQQFASGQPCNNGEMIGFESRECLAKDPSQCTGPFFRYCTLAC